MSKAIKVEDHVYQELDGLKEKGQTFSQVIDDFLQARVKILELFSVLEGRLKFHEWREKELKRLQKAVDSKARSEGG